MEIKMGRPLNQKYFDAVPNGSTRNTVGGESVAVTNGNVDLTFSNVGLGYYTANATVTFSAPQIPGGYTAVGTPVLFGNGAIQAVTLSNVGSGYTTKPTITFLGANTYAAAANITGGGLTSTTTNTIATSAYIPAINGGSSAVTGDIIKQKSGRRYKVQTAQGTGVCKLTNAAPTAGTMTIIATDSQASTYYVTKMTAHSVVLEQNVDGGTGFDYTTGQKAKWIDPTTKTFATVAVAPTTGDIGTVIIDNN